MDEAPVELQPTDAFAHGRDRGLHRIAAHLQPIRDLLEGVTIDTDLLRHLVEDLTSRRVRGARRRSARQCEPRRRAGAMVVQVDRQERGLTGRLGEHVRCSTHLPAAKTSKPAGTVAV
jgi:hypothetical protein